VTVTVTVTDDSAGLSYYRTIIEKRPLPHSRAEVRGRKIQISARSRITISRRRRRRRRRRAILKDANQ
jgi:hypothetical protein